MLLQDTVGQLKERLHEICPAMSILEMKIRFYCRKTGCHVYPRNNQILCTLGIESKVPVVELHR